MKSDLSRSTMLYMLILFWFGLCHVTEANPVKEQNATSLEPREVNEPNESSPAAKPQPLVIWNFDSHRDSIASLKLALSSGLINHVSIAGLLNRKDFDWSKIKTAREAVKIVKKAGAKTIWLRWLWPGYGIERSRDEYLFDPNYYIQEIKALRAEAKKVGADFIGFDTEAYGNSPMKLYLAVSRIKLNDEQLKQIKLAIKKVVQTVGKVDFILPAGSMADDHPYNIIVELGRNRISEHTFYDYEKWRAGIKYPYEIFGVYLNTIKKNQSNPKLPFYLVPEIFEKSHLWSAKKGLFLYPKEGNAEQVARELVKYARSLPTAEPGPKR